MGKYFEITYNPSQWNAPPGSPASSWTTPYGGLHTQAPKNLIGPQFSPALNNFMLRNGELRSRPAFSQFLPSPDSNNPTLGVGSFLSANQVWHTFAFSARGLFQLQANPLTVLARGQNPWTFLGGPSLTGAPVAWMSFAGILYYTNGLDLSAWDGVANAPINDVAFTGASSPPPSNATVFGSIFLGELDNHIIMAYTLETTSGVAVPNPIRVRWSNIGFNPINASGVFGGNLGTAGATFDPNISVNAGFNDFLDVPDLLTGMMTIGRVGYLFRQNGITEFSPTGKGVAPFDFNHLWASQNGIGNVYPFSVAQYGNLGVFISSEQIYKMTPSQTLPMGGSARDAIMVDLANATSSPKASLDRGFSLGTPYLMYNLRIPLSTKTRHYVYGFEDDNWTSWTETGVWPAGTANECWI